MYGDFSRNPFSKADLVTRVLFNQGQPLVEADLNEAINAAIENAKYTCDVVSFQDKDVKCADNHVVITKGLVKTPVGGLRVECRKIEPIDIPSDKDPDIHLVVSQHPFSLAYLKERLQTEDTLHSAEVWGLRFSSRNGKPKPVAIANATFSLAHNGYVPPNSFIRIEYDRTEKSGDKDLHYFKLDMDNGGYANSVKAISQGYCLQGTVCLTRPIVANEFIEVQTPVGKHVVTGMQNKSLLAQIERVSGNSLDAKNLVGTLSTSGKEPLQCRIWTDCKKTEVIGTNDLQVEFCNHAVRGLNFKLCNSSVGLLQPGMYWLFNSEELRCKDCKGDGQDQAKEICICSESPQTEYCLGKVTCDKNAPPVEATNGTSVTGPGIVSPSPNPTSPASDPSPDTPVGPSGAGPNASIDLHAVPTTNLAIGLESPQLRRWLASMTLGELSNLDHNAIRSRVTRDCNIKLQSDSTIDRDIGLIVEKRDRLLSQRGQYVV